MKRLKVLVLAVFIAVFSLPLATNAQQEDGAGGLSISPTRFEYVIERGADELATIYLKNVSPRDIVAKAILNDFEPDGVTGIPKLIVDAEPGESASSLINFISNIEDIKIAAGQTEVVKIPIIVPENAAPGAYYGAIRFQVAPADSANEDNSTQLSLNASVASIMLIEVPGNITEKIEIETVGAYLAEVKGSLFTKKPNLVGITINNLGNGFSKPFGTVIVQGPWGKGEVLNYELNDSSPRGNILPNSKRLFTDELTGISLPGRYTIQANVSHGNGGEVLTATTTFWYIPTWLILVVVLLVLLTAGLAFFLYRKYATHRTKTRRK